MRALGPNAWISAALTLAVGFAGCTEYGGPAPIPRIQDPDYLEYYQECQPRRMAYPDDEPVYCLGSTVEIGSAPPPGPQYHCVAEMPSFGPSAYFRLWYDQAESAILEYDAAPSAGAVFEGQVTLTQEGEPRSRLIGGTEHEYFRLHSVAPGRRLRIDVDLYGFQSWGNPSFLTVMGRDVGSHHALATVDGRMRILVSEYEGRPWYVWRFSAEHGGSYSSYVFQNMVKDEFGPSRGWVPEGFELHGANFTLKAFVDPVGVRWWDVELPTGALDYELNYRERCAMESP